MLAGIAGSNPARGKDVGVVCVVIKDTKSKCRITKTKTVKITNRVEKIQKKSPRGHECLSVRIDVCCHVEVSVTGRSLV